MKRILTLLALTFLFAFAQADLPKIEGGPITKVKDADLIAWGKANAERLGSWILRKDKLTCASVEVYTVGFGILDVERLHSALPGVVTLATGESNTYKVLGVTYPNNKQYVIVFSVGGPPVNPAVIRCAVK